jgi:starch phosphorylase
MRKSMASLTPRFSADRAVREYTEQHYLPGAAAYRERSANKGAVGREIVDWQLALDRDWPGVHFGKVNAETRAGQHFFEVEVFLNGLDPAAVAVELYADGAPPEQHEMERTGPNTYRAQVPAPRWVSDYTPRVVAKRGGVAVPLEAKRILWQR